MIRSLRASFLTRALREKILVLAFILIALLWWLSSFTTRSGAFWREQAVTTSRLREQAEWIRNQTKIEATAQRTAARLDPSKALNGNQLATTVGQLANDAGLRRHGTSTQISTRREGQFAVHTVGYKIDGADWESLVKFYEALQQRAPYIGVDQFTLTSAANNQAQLTLVLRVASIEIAR